MIPVTAISAYLFCPRKLYLDKVLGLIPPPKDVLLKGSVKHQVLDTLNKSEKSIISSISSPMDFPDILSKYQLAYHQALIKTLKAYKNDLSEFKIDIKSMLKQMWPTIISEAKFRSRVVFDFMDRNKLYGYELWQELSPKIVTELKISSPKLRLRGIIDKVEIYANKIYIPFELKSGKPPLSGIWPNQKIQLIAYIHLLKDFFKAEVTKGYIHYIDYNDKREVVDSLNQREQLLVLIEQVHKLYEQNKPPEICKNPKKCKNCAFKDHCFKLVQ